MMLAANNPRQINVVICVLTHPLPEPAPAMFDFAPVAALPDTAPPGCCERCSAPADGLCLECWDAEHSLFDEGVS